MKKHLVGAAVFGIIFLSVSLAFAFFNAPSITQIAEVQVEIDGRMETVVGSGKTSCFGKREKDIAYEIQSTQFDSDNDQFIAKIAAIWKGKGEPPKILHVKTEVYTLEQDKTAPRFHSSIFVTPFKDGKTADLIVKFEIPEYSDFDYRQNLYAKYRFSSNPNENPHGFTNDNVSDAQSVVYFHRTR